MKPNPTLVIFAFCCLLISISLHHCNTPTVHTPPNYDSLATEFRILEKQASLLMIEEQRATERAHKAELALKDRKTVYVERIKTIHDLAPDTCNTYLIALEMECDTLLTMASNVIAAKDTLLVVKDSLIVTQTAQIVNQSVHIDNLRADNKAKDKQVKRAKFFGKLLIGAAVVYTGLVMFFTIVN